jgi:hypothetical protein
VTNSGSLASTKSVEAAASTNRLRRRPAVCLVLTVFNAIVIGKFAETLYCATAHNALQQAGVTLLFVSLLGSLARLWFLALRSRTRYPVSYTLNPNAAERRTAMQPSLGKMSAYKILNWRDQAAGTIDEIVAAFLELGEAIATRWIETRKGVLLLQMVPDDGASGAIYIFDKQFSQWFMLSFEACEDQFTSEKFDRAFSDYDLFRLVEQPGLLLSEFQPANA